MQRRAVFGVAFGSRQPSTSSSGRQRRAVFGVAFGTGSVRAVFPIGSSLPNYDTTNDTGNHTANSTGNNTRNHLSISVFRYGNNTDYDTYYDTGNDMESRTP